MNIDQATYERGLKLFQIFMPYAWRRRKKVMGQTQFGRFVYYTTADTAMKIISTKQLWMRDARCMNDWSEVQYGQNLIFEHFKKTGTLDRFKAVIDKCHPDISPKVVEMYNSWHNHIATNTFICCLSEHGPLPGTNTRPAYSEDDYGRLSMWRAYGGRNAPSVALVFKLPMNRQLSDLWVFFSPVAYLDPPAFEQQIEHAISNIEAHCETVKTMPKEMVVGMGYLMLALAAVSMKHPGFHEEREWRLIHFPRQFESKIVLPFLTTVDGVPQTVYKLPMENRPEHDIDGIDFAQLLDRVIIGPTPYHDTIATALTTELKRVGIQEPEKIIVRSTIPLRT